MKRLAKLVSAILIISLLAIPLAGCSKPLTVSFYEPKDGTTVSEPTVQVRGYVNDPKATVWVNDTIVTLSKTKWFTTDLELAQGENTIKVTAARGKPDKWKDTVARTVTVTYSPQ